MAKPVKEIEEAIASLPADLRAQLIERLYAQEIEKDIGELPSEVRSTFVKRLHENLHEEELPIEEDWEEAAHPMDEIISGIEKGVPAAEVLGRIRKHSTEKDGE